MLVALAVEAHGLALEGVLRVGQRDLAALRRLAGQLEPRQRGAGVAARARGEELEHVVAHAHVAALAPLERAAQQGHDLLGGEGLSS